MHRFEIVPSCSWAGMRSPDESKMKILLVLMRFEAVPLGRKTTFPYSKSGGGGLDWSLLARWPQEGTQLLIIIFK